MIFTFCMFCISHKVIIGDNNDDEECHAFELTEILDKPIRVRAGCYANILDLFVSFPREKMFCWNVTFFGHLIVILDSTPKASSDIPILTSLASDYILQGWPCLLSGVEVETKFDFLPLTVYKHSFISVLAWNIFRFLSLTLRRLLDHITFLSLHLWTLVQIYS